MSNLLQALTRTAATTAAVAVATAGFVALAPTTEADAGVRITKAGRVVFTCTKQERRIPASVQRCKPGQRYVLVTRGTERAGHYQARPSWVRVR